MPSGSTHDRITLWGLPAVASLTWLSTQSSHFTLLVSGSYLFSGLMFGPDLDIHSRQFQRWGWLRWIWHPYQKGLRHRSLWSHGFLVGTTLRILYLLLWISAMILVFWLIQWGYQSMASVTPASQILPSLLVQLRHDITTLMTTIGTSHQHNAIAGFIGLEAGAMSHSVSDWIGSQVKKRHKKTAKRSQDRPSRPSK